jgi:hypothetical protein
VAPHCFEREATVPFCPVEESKTKGGVFAKHYVDLSPQKLKQVYERAGLRVLVPSMEVVP